MIERTVAVTRDTHPATGEPCFRLQRGTVELFSSAASAEQALMEFDQLEADLAADRETADANRRRQLRARRAVNAYRDLTDDPGADRLTVVTDLFSDLMHYLPESEFELALSRARIHYGAEVVRELSR